MSFATIALHGNLGSDAERKRGYSNSPGSFTPNLVEHRGDGVSIITLNHGYVTVIDTKDYPLVAEYRWHIHRDPTNRYARANVRTGKHTTIALHQVITGWKPGLTVDHQDGDGLNNRQSNLRVCTIAENTRNRKMPRTNSTGYKGVRRRASGRFQACITINGARKSLGHFDTPEEAARAYNVAALERFGEFARINQL